MSDLSPIYGISPNGPVPVKVDSLGNLTISETTAQAGKIAVSGNAQTGAGVDTSYTFAQQVNHYRIQNNTSINININEDATATAGSFLLVPMATYQNDKPVTVLHVLTISAQNVNGSAANNILIEGWL